MRATGPSTVKEAICFRNQGQELCHSYQENTPSTKGKRNISWKNVVKNGRGVQILGAAIMLTRQMHQELRLSNPRHKWNDDYSQNLGFPDTYRTRSELSTLCDCMG